MIDDKESWYVSRKPAIDWTEGHILGNGDTAAVVWGGPDYLNIGISKFDVNLYSADWDKYKFPEDYRTMVERIRKHERNIQMPWKAFSPKPHQLACGKITLFAHSGEYYPAITREIDLAKAECRVKTGSTRPLGRKPEPTLKTTVKVIAESNVVLIKLSCEKKKNIKFLYSWDYESAARIDLPSYKNNIMTHSLPSNVNYCVAVSGENIQASKYGLLGEISCGGECGDKTIKIAIASGTKISVCVKNSQNLLAQDAELMEKQHLCWWKNFWKASDLDYEDKKIEDLWRFGLYAMASSTRPHTMPPNLQGIWNQYSEPLWACDFHFNANIQMCHWLCGPCNHPELEEALVRCILFDWRGYLHKNAESFGLPGVAFPLCSDLKGRAVSWSVLSLAMGITAWMTLHLENYLQYNSETKWENDIFDFYCDCAAFYQAVLQKGKDGLWHIYLTESPEQLENLPQNKVVHVLGQDSAMDIAAIKIFFRNFLRLAEKRNYAGTLVEDVKKIISKLPPMPVKDGHLIDFHQAYFHDGDAAGEFKISHRHLSRMFCVYPGDLLHKNNDHCKIGKKSFFEFRSYGERGFSSWSYGWQTAVAARLGLKEETEKIIHRMIDKFQLEGGLFQHGSTEAVNDAAVPVFQFEITPGSTAAINEMMLNALDGTLELFPGVPENRSASFKNFRLPGAFLVSARKIKEQIVYCSISSLKGGCLNFRGREINFKAGETKVIINNFSK